MAYQKPISVGAVFGMWTVLGVVEKLTSKGFVYKVYLCRCTCGNQRIIQSHGLRFARRRSCGCLGASMRTSHGDSKNYKVSTEYNSWKGMKERCMNSNSPHYPRYGGRGISICQRWVDSFENFLSDMGRKPSSAHSIDRINNNGNYEPENCRWATPSMQARNRRPAIRRRR